MGRWPSRTVGAVFLAIGVVGLAGSGTILPLLVFGGLAALTLFAGERTKTEVSSDGVKSVPPLGRAQSYPWSDIDAIVARRIPGGYGSWVVSIRIGEEWVDLTATRRGGLKTRARTTVEHYAQELNGELRKSA
jgi:hypothetical protein